MRHGTRLIFVVTWQVWELVGDDTWHMLNPWNYLAVVIACWGWHMACTLSLQLLSKCNNLLSHHVILGIKQWRQLSVLLVTCFSTPCVWLHTWTPHAWLYALDMSCLVACLDTSCLVACFEHLMFGYMLVDTSILVRG